MRQSIPVALLALSLAGASSPALAGGRLQTFKITDLPAPAGFQIVETIGIQWDARTIPVRYRVNSASMPGDLVPNPLGPAFLTAADATAALQASFDRWNRIKTSYIEMTIVGTVAKTPLRGFDMINELTFGTAGNFTAIASSPSVSLIADSLLEDGDDIDGDGDADVSAAITTAQDVDGDGDIEFPAGEYPAGTILDNDVQFNTKASNGLRFTVTDAEADNVSRSVDLLTVAIHEFGHSHGLSHVLNDNKSPRNGRSAIMFPFIDTGDREAELQGKQLDSDDIAMSSMLYPEATASSGPAAWQWGDVPYWLVYGTVQGEVRHGALDQAVAGASVYAINALNGELVATAFSGNARLFRRLADGALFFAADPAFGVVDGVYTMALPLGAYVLGVEAVDGAPVPAASVSFTTQVGAFYGQQTFNEELWNRNREDAIEKRSGEARPFTVLPGRLHDGFDFVTNRVVNINNFGSPDFIGFSNVTPGLYYAVRIPVEQITAAAPSDPFLVQSAQFETVVIDASTVPRFSEAFIAPGRVSEDGAFAYPDLSRPFVKVREFIGAADDFAPLYVKNPHELGRRIARGIAKGEFDSVFLVLRAPTKTPYPGVSGQAPFIALDGQPADPASNDVPIFGLSYTSVDGVNFVRENRFNFRFTLTLGEAVP
ncbi:MAG: matrixin family metalloprotease [Vicinamibacteraceae bacterium]|nr:matrixin family metalloprotease [Vicinamibacteraceae bacterium]